MRELVICGDLFDCIVDGGGCPIEVLYPEFAACALAGGYFDGEFMHLFILDEAIIEADT